MARKNSNKAEKDIVNNEVTVNNEEISYSSIRNIDVEDVANIADTDINIEENNAEYEFIQQSKIEDAPIWAGHDEWNNSINSEQAYKPYISKPKKCVILCMCCNNEYYKKEFNDIMSTWGADILSGKYPNIDIWGYTSSENGIYEVDNENHFIKVPAMDDRLHTYKKTESCLNMIKMLNMEYDWILKMNCTTTVNLKMLNKLMQFDTLDIDKIYVSHLKLNKIDSAPYFFSPITTGDFIMFSYKYANLINHNSYEISKQFCSSDRTLNADLFKYDNLTLCAIFNTHIELSHADVRDRYVILPTHYIKNLYENGENMQPSVIAIFNKVLNENRPIQNYYYDMHDRYLQFYNDFYNMLDDNTTEMFTMANQIKAFSIESYQNNQLTYYHVPFEQYLTDDMYKVF